MADIESAKEFALHIAKECNYGGEFDLADCAALIEARDNATRLAAKLELLEELCVWYAPEEALAQEEFDKTPPRHWPGLLGAIAELNHKYTQPVEPGQEKR